MAFLFRQFVLGLVVGIIAVALLFSRGDPERLGDTAQVALPLFGFACAAGQGQAIQYFGRYLLLETAVKVPKHTLGDHPINRRPNGGLHGFPSGHTAAAAFGATALVRGCLSSSQPAQAVVVIAAGFTGTSRVEARAHTIWQVLAGAIVGWVLQFWALARFDRWFARMMSNAIARAKGRSAKGFTLIRKGTAAAAALLTLAGPSQSQEFQVSYYVGAQLANESNVSGADPNGVGAFRFTAGWDGRPFEDPLHYGVRGTYWMSDEFGWMLDFNHLKVYGDDVTLASTRFEVLEFSDGLNVITVGPIWRWRNPQSRWTPYASFGMGLNVPYVEVQTKPGAAFTEGYQIAGASVSAVAGASYAISDEWAGFVEYKGTHNWIDVDLDGGGFLETNIASHAFNFGLAYSFN